MVKKFCFYIIIAILAISFTSYSFCEKPFCERPTACEKPTAPDIDKCIQVLIEADILGKIEPDFNKAYVSEDAWNSVNIEQKKLIAIVLARYCAFKRGKDDKWVDIYGWYSGKKIAEYSDTWGLKIY